VRIERFTSTPGATSAPDAVSKVVREPGVTSGSADRTAPKEVLATISVTMDGRRRTFAMAPDDGSVLEAAERAGLELPFSCRSGICATCRTKIVAGGAVMAHNIALEPWETKAGFVLCCQARPTTPSLELSYDEK
jgi:ring-1,2-phenylacetyl-CoA epoxidase subunit PaaE